MVVQFIRLKSGLSEEELLEKAHERAPSFRAIPGLVQKYYVKLGDSGEVGGLYIWDSEESLQAFRESELAQSIPQAYQVLEKPDIETLDVLFQLRD